MKILNRRELQRKIKRISKSLIGLEFSPSNFGVEINYFEKEFLEKYIVRVKLAGNICEIKVIKNTENKSEFYNVNGTTSFSLIFPDKDVGLILDRIFRKISLEERIETENGLLSKLDEFRKTL